MESKENEKGICRPFSVVDFNVWKDKRTIKDNDTRSSMDDTEAESLSDRMHAARSAHFQRTCGNLNLRSDPGSLFHYL